MTSIAESAERTAGRLFALLVVSATTARTLPGQQTVPSERDTARLAEIRVIGAPVLQTLIPGSTFLIEGQALARWRDANLNTALRRVPGLHARDEEGLGLRPNIGIRGLNPTRSSKVLLLEDGIPITIAPYGDNASYYHPPLDRFTRVEVLKGSGQILFGPHTIGGVINYVTPAIPVRPEGELSLSTGNHGHLNAAARAGGTWGRAGMLARVARRSGAGARDWTGTVTDDATLKASLALGPAHRLTFRGNLYRERSNVTYSGLTEAEWLADPRGNAFRNDSMLLSRRGASVSDALELAPGVTLLITGYAYRVRRHWWRQSSSSDQRPNDAADPACGGMQNLNTTCGNEGRLREYGVWGFEPRLRGRWTVWGAPTQFEMGVRAHGERQERRQVNSDSPDGRIAGPASDPGSGITESNLRRTRAVAAFAQHRWFLGRWTITPGLRLEHVRHRRINQLADPEVGGATAASYLVPGIGITFEPARAASLFAGVHRGFAPPRVEDVIDNSTGSVIELDAELSWNYEAGLRARPAPGLELEATAFRLAFANQVVAASVAGGTGAALTNAGRTLHQGLEAGARLDAASLFGVRHHVAVEVALTWLATARFEGPRFVYVGTAAPDVIGKVYAAQNGGQTRTQASVTGNRLPYAPHSTVSASVSYRVRDALDVRAGVTSISRQFGDALNTGVTVPDGQQGPLPACTVADVAANYTMRVTRTTIFMVANNVFNRLCLADRTRGLLPGAPRTVRGGISQLL